MHADQGPNHANGATMDMNGVEVETNDFITACRFKGTVGWKARANWSLINVDNPSNVTISPAVVLLVDNLTQHPAPKKQKPTRTEAKCF